MSDACYDSIAGELEKDEDGEVDPSLKAAFLVLVEYVCDWEQGEDIDDQDDAGQRPEGGGGPGCVDHAAWPIVWGVDWVEDK